MDDQEQKKFIEFCKLDDLAKWHCLNRVINANETVVSDLRQTVALQNSVIRKHCSALLKINEISEIILK